MADALKAPAPPQPVSEESEFVKNPGGAIHDVDRSHPAVALAAKGQDGWRFGSAEEIAEYCKAHNLELPDPKESAARVAKLRKAAEKPAAAVEAVAEPITQPAGIAVDSDLDSKPAKKS